MKTRGAQREVRGSGRPVQAAPRARVFLLSPARCDGVRMSLLLRPAASFPLARAFRSAAGAPLGDVFAFASGLYFRGKLAYARAFGRAPSPHGSTFVITPGAGLVEPDRAVRPADIRRWADVPVDVDEVRYRLPLERDARRMAAALHRRAEVVLLGSIASDKYVDLLLDVFGPRLLFPVDFVGRGDMSRGGLLLRAARGATELAYGPVQGAVRRGVRPPRLPAVPRAPAPG